VNCNHAKSIDMSTIKLLNLKNISTQVIVTDPKLGDLMRGLNLAVELEDWNMQSNTNYTLKLAIFRHQMVATKKYILCFAFDPDRKSKLGLIDSDGLDSILASLEDVSKDDWATSTVIVIGRTGSRELNKLRTCFCDPTCAKVIVHDFSANSSDVGLFIRTAIDDIERVETRISHANNPTRTEIASLPLSEKTIRLNPDDTDSQKRKVMFANQLLQIPGITDKLALALAEQYRTPKDLMTFISAGNTLADDDGNSCNDSRRYVYCIRVVYLLRIVGSMSGYAHIFKSYLIRNRYPMKPLDDSIKYMFEYCCTVMIPYA
jgi:hypothetical protein